MAKEPLPAVLEFLGKVCAPREMLDLPDAQLLERFLATRDEIAFALLMERHGPMVLGLCRRVLGEAADDAFQATFLVLARRAAVVRKDAPLGPWLYGVAQRVALKARATMAARQSRQRELTDMPRESLDERTWQELRPVLDEEIGRLPDKCRAAIVLCYFEGKSYDQAAQELGLPKSTLASRLARGRDLLRRRLVKRGITVSAAALTTALAEKTAGAAVAALLTVHTVKAVVSFAARQTVAETIVSVKALALAEEAMKSMIGIKSKMVLMLVALSLAVGAALAGYGAWVVPGSPNEDDQRPPVVQGDPPKKVAPGPAKDLHGDPLPAGAVARLGQDRWLHGANADFADFLPDGKTVVTLCSDRTIRVWEFPAGKEIRRVALSDGAFTFKVPIALSKDGKAIASCTSNQQKIDLHDIATGKPLQGLEVNGRVSALAFAPDGNNLAAYVERDGSLQIWDWAKTKVVRSFPAGGAFLGKSFGPRFLRLTYAPNGKSIATGRLVDDQNPKLGYVVKLWEPATGDLISEIRTGGIEMEFGGLALPPLSLAFSPDSKTLAWTTGEAVTLVQAATGKATGKMTTGKGFSKSGLMPSRGMVFSNDGSKLYASRGLGLVEWDVATCKELRQHEQPSGSGGGSDQMSMALSPDGNTLVMTGTGPQFFDLTVGKKMTAVNHPTLPQLSIQFLPDGKSLLTYSQRSQSAQKWDAVSGKALGPVGLANRPFNFPISPDGKVFADCEVTYDGTKVSRVNVVVKEADSGKTLCQFPLQLTLEYTGDLDRVVMRFSPNGKTLAVRQPGNVKVGTDEKIELYEIPSGNPFHTLRADPVRPRFGGVSHLLVFSPDGKTLVSPADVSTLGLWDTATSKRIGSIPLPESTKKPSGLSGIGAAYAMPTFGFSPDGRCLALDTSDGTIALYELASAKPRSTFSKKAMGMDRSCFAFSPDGKCLAQAGADGIVHVWDIGTGKELATFERHAEGVNAVAFAPDGKTLASASDDSTALIWDLSKLKRPALPAKALKPADLEKCWQTLAEPDADKAWAAMIDLVAAPKEAVPWLKERLKPVAALDAKRVQELIGQLDDLQFKVRDSATKELLQLGEQIVPALDKALAAKPPLEAKQRQEKLRDKLTGLLLEGERLRAYRAVEVLELIGTAEARQALEALAKGAPGALVTTSAQAALKR
jgi:RNA polymerase sigma factor (sigma-70 family)